MARSREVFGFEDDALRHFVDREDALALARELVMDTPAGDEVPALVFYGIGGMGKSTLLQKIRRDICQQRRPEYHEAHIPHSFVDFAHPRANVHDAENLVHHVKRELERYERFQFPRFELILARLRQLQRIAPGDRLGEFPVLVNVLENLPGGIGDLLAAIRAAGELDCFKHRAYHRLNIADALMWEYPHEAENRLASALADDINDLMENGGRRPAILFDTLDWLDLRNRRDGLVQAVADLCHGLPNVPIIVGIRAQDQAQVEQLPCFRDGRALHCISVDVIPADDNGRYRREYLISRGVSDESHDSIIDVTGGHALWMGVAADIALRIQEDEGRALTAQDLHDAADDREKLFARLAEALDEKTDHRHLLRHACVCRWFDRKLLSAVTGREVTYEAFNALTRLSMVRVARTDEEGKPTAWAVHQTLRSLSLRLLAEMEELKPAADLGVWETAQRSGWVDLPEPIYFITLVDLEKGRAFARRIFGDAITRMRRELANAVALALTDAIAARRMAWPEETHSTWEVHAFRADIHMLDGNGKEALTSYDHALQSARLEGTVSGECHVLNNIGNAHAKNADYEKALRAYKGSLVLARKLGDGLMEARTEGNMGNVMRARGNMKASKRLYERSLNGCRRHGATLMEGHAFNNLGEYYRQVGLLREAWGHYEKGLSIAVSEKDDLSQARILNNQGLVRAAQGKREEARALYGESMRLKVGMGDEMEVASTLQNVAELDRLENQLDKAADGYKHTLSIYRSFGNREGIARALTGLGAVRADQGRMEDARAAWLECRVVADECGIPLTHGISLMNLGLLAQETGNVEAARKHWNAALTALEGMGVPEEAQVRKWLLELNEEEGRRAET